LLGHFWVNGARLSTYQQGYLLHSEPKVPLSALTDPAFDYVALGHIHKHQDLNPNGQPHVVYAGSPDRIDFGEKDETKGFVLVNLSKGGAEYEFIPIAEGRPFLEITVDAEGPEPMEAIRAEIRRHALRNAIVKLTYRVGPEQLGLVQEREIREALSGAFLVVSVNRSVRRESSERSRLFKETLGPREALELFIDQRPDWLPRKAQLLERAEELFQELNDPD
jgi:exonuclease SbcD